MATPTEQDYAAAPYAPQPAPTKRVTSGKTLFLVTLGVVVVGVVLAVIAGVAGVAWLGFVVPIAYFVYLVALLYFAGRAISYRARPGEAATSILLAVLLIPVVVLTPAVGLAGNALADSGLGGLTGLGGTDELSGEGGAFLDDSGGEQWFSSELPPGAREDVTESEYNRYIDCLESGAYDDATCEAIVS